MNYDNWTPDQLRGEIAKLQAKVTEVRQARIDELWPSYYNALTAMARNSLEAMTQVESLVIGNKNPRDKKIKKIVATEIASLHEFIEEIEIENALQDITVNTGGK